MRVVKLKIFWGPGVLREVWTVTHLLRVIDHEPLLLPPMSVLNQFFEKGTHQDETGAYRWEPFTITSQEYEELSLELLTNPHGTYQQVSVPKWVNTVKKWHKWKWDY